MMDEVFIKTQQQKMQRDREAILIDKVLKFEILTGEGGKNATSSLSMQSIVRGLDLHARVPT